MTDCIDTICALAIFSVPKTGSIPENLGFTQAEGEIFRSNELLYAESFGLLCPPLNIEGWGGGT